MAEMTHLTAIALGSNLGNTEKNLQTAIQKIEANIGQIEDVSSFISSEAEGFDSEYTFSNACLLCRTSLEPMQLLEQLKHIEFEMGRTKTKDSYEDRIIDLDIIFFEDLLIQSIELTIPHPRFMERSFVLLPLCEIVKTHHSFWPFLLGN